MRIEEGEFFFKLRAVEKNPCTGTLELIYKALTQFSWCDDAYCLHLLNGMITVVLFSLFMHLFQCCGECVISC